MDQRINITFNKCGDRCQAIHLHFGIKIQCGFKKMSGRIGHKKVNR